MSKVDLGPEALLRLHLRIAFHDWMWSGGNEEECGRVRRLCRRLPTYFSDPWLDGLPRSHAEWDEMVSDGRLMPVEVVGPPPPSNLTFDYTTSKFYPTPQTWSTAAVRPPR